MEEYIMDNGKSIIKMAMDTIDSLMGENIMDSTRMITVMEKECTKRMANYSKSNMKMMNSSAKLKYESSITLTAN